MIMELAKYQEVMTWNTNTYQFTPNSFLIKSGQYIAQEHILKILRDCINGLEYLHNVVGIVHRDIKPQNILLCHFLKDNKADFVAKICDFGVSEKLEKPFDEHDMMTKTAGTYHFFPPECCDPNIEIYSGKAADIWALGVSFYCILFNQLPFWNEENQGNEFSILEYILNNEV